MTPTKAIALIVDDDEAHRYSIRRMLHRAGFELIEAKTGKEGLDLARKNRPDLIVLDVNLPDLHGFLVCQKLKSEPATSSIPVLHLSASRVRTGDRAEGLQWGADGYLTAPVDESEFLATVRALLRVRESEARALALACHWQSTFDAIREAIGLMDPRGILTQCNAALSALLGEPAAALVGRNAYALLEERLKVERKTLPPFPALARQATEGPAGERWLHFTLDPIGEEAGGMASAVLIIADYTERRRFLDDVARSNAELRRFAHVVSHDLKEPLRAVTNSIQIAQRRAGDAHDAETKRLLAFALSGSFRMNRLIEDLLSYAEIGSREPEPKPVDTGKVVATVVEDLAPTITEARAEVLVEPLPPVHAEESRVRRLFQNLIANAIKFRGSAPPKVTVSGRQEAGEYVFSVADNGIGIDPRWADRIFAGFQRLHSHDEYPGTGLGLAICARIVQLHGGRIWFDSIPGAGSTFHFTIPVVEPEPSHHQSSS